MTNAIRSKKMHQKFRMKIENMIVDIQKKRFMLCMVKKSRSIPFYWYPICVYCAKINWFIDSQSLNVNQAFFGVIRFEIGDK